MKIRLRDFSFALLAVALCSCAAPTKLTSTWKSPDYHNGPVAKIAVLAIDEGGFYRPVIEGQFVHQFKQEGQPAIPTIDLLKLSEITSNKTATAAKLRAAGADSILIIRLANRVTRSSVGPDPTGGSTVTAASGQTSWFEYYSTYSTGSGGTQYDLKVHIDLETSLYDLDSEKKLWSGYTQTILRNDMARESQIGPMAAMILKALRTDGFIR
jgi:hypothetical protein